MATERSAEFLRVVVVSDTHNQHHKLEAAVGGQSWKVDDDNYN